MLNFKENYVHIISFDVPYPANYGGVIDVFYKIKSLSECGINIILHCFQYGRKTAPELEKYCTSVHYYQRKKYGNPMSGKLPYIVSSRENPELLNNLLKDDFPIIFEGLHTTFYLDHPDLKNRLKVVRNHNIEHDYYKNLEEVEGNWFKKRFFRKEANRLKEYESKLLHATYVIAISQPDTTYLKSKGINARWISAFHSNDYVDIKKGTGDYIFYHGNLGVAENNHAAIYLANKVFKLTNLPTIIAGNNPSRELRNAAKKLSHVTLKDDLTNEQILDHIKEAQINVLVTFQATGIKLKLINSLYLGRHTVVNGPMVDNTGLESLCHIGNNPLEIAEEIFNLWDKPFSNEMIKERKQILEGRFSNSAGAEKILNLLKKEEGVKS